LEFRAELRSADDEMMAVHICGNGAAGMAPSLLKIKLVKVKNPNAPAVKREAEEDWENRAASSGQATSTCSFACPPLNIRVGALNFVEAECGRKNVDTKSFLIDLLLRFWRYRFDRPDLPPVLRMPFRRKWRILRDDSSIRCQF
jgi:hypothetical protein